MSIINPYLRTCAVCGLFDYRGLLLVRKRIIIYKTRSGEPLCDGCFEWYRGYRSKKRRRRRPGHPKAEWRAFWGFRRP